MKIILIEEENHGFIGAVTRKDLILPWLVRNNWVNQFTEVYEDKDSYDYKPLKDIFGLTWYQSLTALDFDVLCDMFDGTFYFSEEEVWEG